MYVRVVFVGCVLALAVGCSGTRGEAVENAELKGADETVPAPAHALSGCVSAQTWLETAAPLNLRQGPSTEAPIVLTLPEGAELSVAAESCPDNGFYKVRFGGFEGWAYGAWLNASTATLESALSYANTRSDAIARARTGVGFSYWWGGGKWLEGGPTSTTKGACTGSCPSCSHSGSYGADCSGFAAKVWVVPSTNQPVSLGSHPYSTYNFDNEYHGWHNVARGSVQMADAMVYNDGGGHIFVYEKGDPWGSMYTYECRNCSDGCVYGIRTAGSAYKAIGRDGMTQGASSGGDGNVYAVQRSGTGTGTTEVHVLNRATNYQSFLYQTSTALHETGTDGSWMFRMADYNNDGRLDLWAIAKTSAQTDVHVLNGADNFKSFLLHAATALHPTGSDLTWIFLVGDYNADGRKDLYAINKNANGKTDVHVLNGADNFRTFLLHSVSGSANAGTDNSQMLDLADYNNDGKLDLWFIAKGVTGSGMTEVHILSGADGFKTYIAHSATGLHLTGADGRWYFSVGDYNGDGRPDLYAIDKQDTASGKTAVHVLNGADGFKSFLLHSASALHLTGTDHRWVFDL
jgi:Tfp pilus assembly protein FimT